MVNLPVGTMQSWITNLSNKKKGNENDPHAVAITRNNFVVGPLPQNICDNFWKFLSQPKKSVRAWVLGKRVTRDAGYSLEIHVLFFKAMSKE